MLHASLVAQPVKNLPAIQETACNARDLGLIHWLGRSLGEGHGNPLQYSCLGNPMDREAWQATWHHKRVGDDLVTKPPPPTTSLPPAPAPGFPGN